MKSTQVQTPAITLHRTIAACVDKCSDLLGNTLNLKHALGNVTPKKAEMGVPVCLDAQCTSVCYSSTHAMCVFK